MERFAKQVSFAQRTAPVYDKGGVKVREIALEGSVFGREPNIALMHQVVVGQLAGIRAGTQSTKTRAEVSGGGAKPYRQKGTGRARQGSTRSPQFSGGGVALGPKPRKYTQRTPKKMVAQALFGALSDRAAAGAVCVLEGFDESLPKTKLAQKWVDALEARSSVLLVVEPTDEVLAKSFRNLPNVEVAFPSQLSAYLVLVNDLIVFTPGTLPGGMGEAVKAAPKRASRKAAEASAPEVAEPVEPSPVVEEEN
jgi:large subunit ribosomal protein L4